MAILYHCSDGSRLTDKAIQLRYSVAIRQKHIGQTIFTCQGCLQAQAVDNSHIISKARCKTLHKAELIWNPLNFFDACRSCHHCWENFKSGDWVYLKNVVECLRFLKEHDPEGYQIRIELTKGELNGQGILEI